MAADDEGPVLQTLIGKKLLKRKLLSPCEEASMELATGKTGLGSALVDLKVFCQVLLVLRASEGKKHSPPFELLSQKEMAVSVLASHHRPEVVVPQSGLQVIKRLVLINCLRHDKSLLDDLLIFPLPTGKALKALHYIIRIFGELTAFYLRTPWRVALLYWLLEHISEARLQLVFLLYEYCLFCLHFQESFHIKVDAKEVAQIIRIHVLNVNPQLPTIVADGHFSVHDTAYRDTKHIPVMVKKQLTSENLDIVVKRLRDYLSRLSLRLLVYVLPTKHRH